MDTKAKIYIAGDQGLVGSALLRKLQSQGYHNLVTRSHAQLDLTNQAATEAFFASEQPEFVLLAAARVGGIYANNTFRAEFLYQNLMIQANVIHAAWQSGVKRLLFLGANCVYPRASTQPIKEEALLTGALEPTNEPYAVAKIAGVKLCESYNRQYGTSFITAMPACLYGPKDHYDEARNHVIPALIRRAHEAKKNREDTLTIWGSGSPLREFLYVDDLAEAALFLLNQPVITENLFNIGTGRDISIRELAGLICEVVGFQGKLVFDTTKPDGIPRKLLDVERINALGWRARTELRAGIKQTYQEFLQRVALDLIPA